MTPEQFEIIGNGFLLVGTGLKTIIILLQLIGFGLFGACVLLLGLALR